MIQVMMMHDNLNEDSRRVVTQTFWLMTTSQVAYNLHTTCLDSQYRIHDLPLSKF